MRRDVKPEFHGHVEIDLQALRMGRGVEFDLYIAEGSELVLYRAASLPFRTEDSARLAQSGVHALYVPAAQESQLSQYFEQHLDEILDDEAVSTAAKARTVLFTAEHLARDILAEPGKRTLRRAIRVIHGLAKFGTTNPLAVRQLVRSALDRRSLHAHSANTAVYALAIAHRDGARNLERVAELTMAAYLHDVGMSEIPSEILEKPGPLDANEWARVQQHPEIGERIIAATGAFSDRVTRAVRMHHERLDGGGYPDGARGAETPWEARVTAVAEVYDALTSEQPYRPSIRSFQAIQLMLEGEAGALDRDAIRSLIPALSGDLPGGKAESD